MDKKRIKKMTSRGSITAMKRLLIEVQKKRFHYPDSDAQEYCNGCGHSPYNIPQHQPDCLVVAIDEVLKRV